MEWVTGDRDWLDLQDIKKKKKVSKKIQLYKAATDDHTVPVDEGLDQFAAIQLVVVVSVVHLEVVELKLLLRHLAGIHGDPHMLTNVPGMRKRNRFEQGSGDWTIFQLLRFLIGHVLGVEDLLLALMVASMVSGRWRRASLPRLGRGMLLEVLGRRLVHPLLLLHGHLLLHGQLLLLLLQGQLLLLLLLDGQLLGLLLAHLLTAELLLLRLAMLLLVHLWIDSRRVLAADRGDPGGGEEQEDDGMVVAVHDENTHTWK